MKLLSEGLQKSAGNRMKAILNMMTKNRFISIMTGVIITVIIQSSSATTVMVVSFVNAGLMVIGPGNRGNPGSKYRNHGYRMDRGTAGIQDEYILLALTSIAFALPLLFSKRSRNRDKSDVLLGFGLLFLGLNSMSNSIPSLSGQPQALAFLATFNANTLWTNFLCLLVGLVVTVIINHPRRRRQSSLQWDTTVGSALKRCGDDSGGHDPERRSPRIWHQSEPPPPPNRPHGHISSSMSLEVLLLLIFFRPLLTLVNWIVPGDVFALTGEALAQALPVFLAMFATVAALSKTILMFPFVTPYARLIERLFPQKAEYEEGTYHFRYIGAPFIDSPEIYMLAIRDEIKKMANLACTMLARYRSMFDSPNNAIDDLVDLMRRDEEYADQMQEQLSNFIVHLLQDSQTTTNASSLNSLIRVMDELESVTDSCYALARLSQRRYKMGWNYEDEILKEMETFHLIVQEFLNYVRDRMDRTLTKAEMQKANEYEDQINALRADLGNKVQDRLSEGVGDVKAELLILELIRHLEHIGDYCTNIAEAYHQAVKHTPVCRSVRKGSWKRLKKQLRAASNH